MHYIAQRLFINILNIFIKFVQQNEEVFEVGRPSGQAHWDEAQEGCSHEHEVGNQYIS